VTVSEWLAAAGVALGVFAATNIDDVLVLTVLFVSSRSAGRPRPWGIVAGQYLGFSALLAASVIISFGLLALDERWVRLLGLLPIALGARSLWLAYRRRAEDAPPIASSWLAVAGVTIANGADNVSVYAPLLRVLDPIRLVITVVVFFVGVAIWVAIARGLGTHQRVAQRLGRIQHWLGPLIFIALGVTILLDVL
jgi:cadmium resistance protein CadD (predicted permease)